MKVEEAFGQGRVSEKQGKRRGEGENTANSRGVSQRQGNWHRVKKANANSNHGEGEGSRLEGEKGKGQVLKRGKKTLVKVNWEHLKREKVRVQ